MWRGSAAGPSGPHGSQRARRCMPLHTCGRDRCPVVSPLASSDRARVECPSWCADCRLRKVLSDHETHSYIITLRHTDLNSHTRPPHPMSAVFHKTPVRRGQVHVTSFTAARVAITWGASMAFLIGPKGFITIVVPPLAPSPAARGPGKGGAVSSRGASLA